MRHTAEHSGEDSQRTTTNAAEIRRHATELVPRMVRSAVASGVS
jgi:hypothetical protein